MKHLSVQTLSSYQTQRKSFENRPHIVAPVVLITEGVHCGSGGCAYYPAEELSSFTASWNGIPVPIYHPTSSDGTPLSCNSPEVIEQNNIGRLFNVVYDNGKLKGELWIDEAKAKELAPEVLTALEAGKILEVSTGLFSDDEAVEGIWNGKKYQSIVRNIRPDHLAILPEQTGACSVVDGCGIRANKGDDVDEKTAVLNFLANGRRGTSYEDRRRMIQKEMDKRDVRPEYNSEGTLANSYIMHYIMATYPGYFVCLVETPGANKMFKCSYTMNGDAVEIADDMVEVREETNYVEVTANAEAINSVKKEEKGMKTCCPEKVEALVANTTNGFTEDDKAWLLELTPEAFERIVANTAEVKEVIPAEVKKAETAEEVVANATDEMKAKVEAGLKMLEEKKASLVAGIVANKQNPFTAEELNAKSIAELEKITAFAVKPDFSGAGGADVTHTNVGSAEETLDLPS